MAEDIQDFQDLRKVPVSEILDKIKNGEPVEYDHVTIFGDIDVRKLNLPKDGDKFLVESSIEIANSEFFGDVDFSNTIFRKVVDFSRTEFIINSCFRETYFNDDSYFIETIFNFGASFDKSRFNNGASFLSAKFNLGCSFLGTLFEANAWFVRAQFGLDSLFKDTKFNGEANFMEAQFAMKTNFVGTKFVESVSFTRTQFGLHACFEKAQFCRKSYFNLARVYGDIDFNGAQFCGDAYFDGVQIKKDAIFTGAKFGGKADFAEARMGGNADFREASFITGVHFVKALFEGDVLTFRDAVFGIPQFQEDACRRAKNMLERNGNREEAGYHYYREMDAKRKQKPWYYRYLLEYIPIQLVFGYGVYPPRLIACWIIIIIFFGLLYWIGGGINGAVQLSDCIKFSFAAAIAPGYIANTINPGYTGYQPTPIYQVVAGLEAILGTFMWAAFIATFARKYMR